MAEFTCPGCDRRLPAEDSAEEQIRAEYARQFPDYSPEEMMEICGDCFPYLFQHRERLKDRQLINFIRESNHIEGIERDPLFREMMAHVVLLGRPRVTVQALEVFVATVQPDAELRRRQGQDVQVGYDVPPPGGPAVERTLEWLLAAGDMSPWERHWNYEKIHPFTDGNGRSGRALWLHEMGGGSRRGFLHEWYYQSLRHSSPAGRGLLQ